MLTKGTFGLGQKALDQIDRDAKAMADKLAKLRGYGPFDSRTALLQSQIANDMPNQYGFRVRATEAPITPGPNRG